MLSGILKLFSERERGKESEREREREGGRERERKRERDGGGVQKLLKRQIDK